MRKYFDRWTLAGAALALILWGLIPSSTRAAIIQAIVPVAVPTANFQGTATSSSKFQGASGSTVNGHCAQYDATGLLVDSGAGCVGSGSGTPGSTLFSATTSAGPNNSAAETSLIGTVTGSTTIAANTFTDGAILEARAQGFFSLPTVADALTLRMKCGSTVIGSASTTLPAGALTNGTFRFWLLITSRGTGAGGAFITNGLAEFTGSALTPSEIKVLNTSTVAFDFTTSCAFAITAQWGGAQSGELMTATNAAAWFPGAPVTSVGGLTGAVPGQGNGTKVQMAGTVSGTGASLCTDAGGNTTTSGCSSGGSPGGSATQWQYNNSTFAGLVGTSAIPQSGWSIINCGSQCAYSDFSAAFQSFMIWDNGTTNWRLVTRSLPSSTSYTVIATINCLGVIPTNTQICGLYLSDGTKLEGVEIISQNGAGLEYQLRVEKMATTSTDTGTLAGPTGKIIPNPATLKIVGDATHRTFSYWSNGAYVQFFQEAIGTFLTETTVGFGGLSNSGNTWINPQLLYWSLTNP